MSGDQSEKVTRYYAGMPGSVWYGEAYAYDGMDRLTTGGYGYDVIGNQSVAPGGVSYT